MKKQRPRTTYKVIKRRQVHHADWEEYGLDLQDSVVLKTTSKKKAEDMFESICKYLRTFGQPYETCWIETSKPRRM